VNIPSMVQVPSYTNVTALIDICTKWIEDRKAVLICKDDKVYWFASLTNRDIDRSWQSLTLTEAIRTIKYTLLQPEDKLTPDILVKSFQELGQVYEAAVESAHPVPSYIYNLKTNSTSSVREDIIKELLLYMRDTNCTGMQAVVFKAIVASVSSKLGMDIVSAKTNDLIREYCVLHGYTYREGVNRLNVRGSKVTCILRNGRSALAGVNQTEVTAIIYQKLKPIR